MFGKFSSKCIFLLENLIFFFNNPFFYEFHSFYRHLLSADTKAERDEWCAYFNKALALMRAWGNSERQQSNRN